MVAVPMLPQAEFGRNDHRECALHFTTSLRSFHNCSKMVAALYNISQWEVFLRILYNELIKSSKQIETLNNKLEEIYKQIQMAVQMRTAVPTRQV